MCDAALRVDAWWEWVPSAANVADLPSRAASTWGESARALMAKIHQRISDQGFGRRTLRLPTADQLDDPVAMMRGARDGGGGQGGGTLLTTASFSSFCGVITFSSFAPSAARCGGPLPEALAYPADSLLAGR